MSWYFCECALIDTEEKKLLNKIFFFFSHKKYSPSFIKLQLNHWCYMDYFNNVLTMFLAFERLITLLSMQGQKALGFHQKYLNLYSEDEQRSYGFGTTWGWVINDRIFIFGWTIPLNINRGKTEVNTYSSPSYSLHPAPAGPDTGLPESPLPCSVCHNAV